MRSACFWARDDRPQQGGSGTPDPHLHTTFDVSGDRIPLGVVSLEFDAPDGGPDQGRPVEESKIGRWLRGLHHSIAAAKELDAVKAVAVMDREGDVFDVFLEHRAAAAAGRRCWCGRGMTAATACRHPRPRQGPATWWRATILPTKSRTGRSNRRAGRRSKRLSENAAVLSSARASYPVLTFNEVANFEVRLIDRPVESCHGTSELSQCPTGAAVPN